MSEEETRTVRQIHGSCHCGNIRFTFERPDSGGAIPVRACGCSFCQKHRGVWTSHPQGRVLLALDDPSRVQRYRFGTETAVCVCRAVTVSPETLPSAAACNGAAAGTSTFPVPLF